MIEKEIRGYISNEIFENVLKEFETKFGKAKVKKRIAMVLGDFENYDLEIRIRITNGEQEITYKIGDQNALNRKEITSELSSDTVSFVNLFKTFKHLSDRFFKDPYTLCIQHENYYFIKDSFEIKLFKQFNDKNYFCGFEVEQNSDSDLDIFDFTKSLGLNYAEDYNTKEVVRERNNKYNIDLSSYPEEQLIKLIDDYLVL